MYNAIRIMKSDAIPTRKEFYFNAIKGRPSAEVFHGIFCVYSLLEKRLDEYFKPHDLTPVKFNALMLIKHLGGTNGVSQQDIGHHLIVSPSNITRLLNRLAADEYIERSACSKDRRVKLVRITPKGERVIGQVFFGFGETVQQSVYLMDRTEVEDLSHLLIKWFLKLEAAGER